MSRLDPGVMPRQSVLIFRFIIYSSYFVYEMNRRNIYDGDYDKITWSGGSAGPATEEPQNLS